MAHRMYKTVGGLFSKTKDGVRKLEKCNLEGNHSEDCDKV